MWIAVTREVSPALGDCELSYISRAAIDVARAGRQHQDYQRALEVLGCRLVTLPAEPAWPDSVFVEDVAIVLDEVAIMTRPGALSRRAEVASVAAALRDVPIEGSKVAILSFGVGFMAGVPTLLLLVYNGLIVGAFLAIHYQRGLLIDCIGWLSIHGVTELGAFILCGAAGLVVAEKIIFTGRYSRLEALSIHGKQAAIIACGAVAMLFIAGFIEGGLRQLINVTSWRFAFAAVTAVLWGVYFLYCGKASFDLTGSPRIAKTRRQKPFEQGGVQP